MEEYFYLALPPLTLLLMRRPSARTTALVLASLVAAGAALRASLIAGYPDEVYTRIYYPTYTRLDGLLFGVTLALVQIFRPAWWTSLMQRGHTLFLLGAACVFGVVLLFWQNDVGSSDGMARWGTIFGFPLLALGWSLVTASSLSTHGLLARVRVPFSKTLAALAFALYLTHKAVAHAAMLQFPRVAASHGPASWLLYAFACLGAAGLLHVAVEMPCLRLRDRRAVVGSARALEEEARREPAL